jgi:hypothetical protein
MACKTAIDVVVARVNDIHVALRTLTLSEDDVLVCQLGAHLSSQAKAALRETLARALKAAGKRNKCLVCDEDVRLTKAWQAPGRAGQISGA